MTDIPIISRLDLAALPQGHHKMWFRAMETGIGTYLDLPVVVMRGAPGPCVYIQAALHGDELAGVAVIHQLLDTLDPAQMRGTVVAIPCANPTGMVAHSRHARSANEGLTLTDLNRQMPGREDHRDANARFAHALWDRLYAGQPDVFLDLHTMTHGNTFPFFVFADLSNREVDRLVRLLPADQVKNDPGEAGSVETEMVAAGVPALTFELGGPKVCDPEMTRRGLQGVRNILIDRGIIDGEIDLTGPTTFEGDTFVDIRATRGGFAEMLVAMGQDVTKGQSIARQRNAFGEVVAEYTAPEPGRVLSIASDPIREPGALIARLLR